MNRFSYPLEEHLRRIEAQLDTATGLRTRLLPAREAGRVPHLHLHLLIDAAVAGVDALALSRRLQEGEPPVHLSERLATQNTLIVDLQALAPEDDAAVVAALRRVFAR